LTSKNLSHPHVINNLNWDCHASSSPWWWSNLNYTTYNLQHFKAVTALVKLNACSISICELEVPKIYSTRKLTFRNWLSWIHHQFKGLTMYQELQITSWTRTTPPTISAWKDSSIYGPTINSKGWIWKLTLLVDVKTLQQSNVLEFPLKLLMFELENHFNNCNNRWL
jgi:hypothetical protein